MHKSIKALRDEYKGKNWKPFKRNPEKGDQVRVTEFGDDYQRVGVVVGTLLEYAFIDFGYDDGNRERYHRNKLELWS